MSSQNQDIKKRVEQDKSKGIQSYLVHQPILKEDDPLFGVLEESQVGINPATGRLSIAHDVLEGKRLYMLSASGSERIIREQRVKASLADIESDPIAQKDYLSLESIPIYHKSSGHG